MLFVEVTREMVHDICAMKKVVFFSVLALSVAMLSCKEDSGCDKGEGASEKRTSQFGELPSLNLSMVADLTITQDTFRKGIMLGTVAQTAMHRLLEYDSTDKELTIRLKDCIREHNDVLMDARFSTLPDRIVVSSAGTVQSGELIKVDSLKLINQGLGDIDLLVKSREVDVRIEESGNVILGGECKRLEVWTVSSGDLRAFNLIVDTVDIEFIGSNFIEVYATDLLIVNFRIPGTVHYRGNPRIITIGEGELIDRNL